MTPDELRARFLSMHDPGKVQRAESAALLACALAVYEGTSTRRERAQEALLSAIEQESEWAAIVHGLAIEHARSIDRSRSPALQASYVAHGQNPAVNFQESSDPETGEVTHTCDDDGRR